MLWSIYPGGRLQSAEFMVEFWHFWVRPIVGPRNTHSQQDSEWMKPFGSRVAFNRRGFEVGRMPAIGTDSTSRLVMEGYTWWVGVPDWFAMIGLAVLPAVAWGRRRRAIEQERKERGQCIVCGYDLRATPERCPECRTVVANMLLKPNEPPP